jgi:hypothetical protein
MIEEKKEERKQERTRQIKENEKNCTTTHSVRVGMEDHQEHSH